MKKLVLVLVCSFVCAGCAKPLTTLSDGQPGYAVYCETFRNRCVEEIARLCRGKSHTIVTERARESNLPIGWVDTGAPHPQFNSRYWMEVRCE
jgi:hypothetical protein